MKTYRRVFATQEQLEKNFEKWVSMLDEATNWYGVINREEKRMIVKSMDEESQYAVQWILGDKEEIHVLSRLKPDKVFFDEAES